MKKATESLDNFSFSIIIICLFQDEESGNVATSAASKTSSELAEAEVAKSSIVFMIGFIFLCVFFHWSKPGATGNSFNLFLFQKG